MFNKEIFKDDFKYLDTLQKQQANCMNLIKQGYDDVLSKELDRQELEIEKSTIAALQDQFDELNREIILVKEQMYLNFTHSLKVSPASASEKIPHIDTITM